MKTQEKEFPNGFLSWMETHHEVVSFLTLNYERDKTHNGKVSRILEEQGTGGLYEFAEDLTDKFENENKDKSWDGDFFEELESFLMKQVK